MASNDAQRAGGRPSARPTRDYQAREVASNGGADERRRSASGAHTGYSARGTLASERPSRTTGRNALGDSLGSRSERGQRDPHDSRDSREPRGQRASRDSRTGRDASGPSRKQAKKPRKKWPFVVAGVFATLVVGVIVAFSCWRWTFADDAQDIQGTWYIAGTQKAALITADGIQLADDVTYSYTLDADAKTLSLSFGNMTGSARYRFSLDRQTLAIRDGETSWDDSLTEDITWSIGAFARAIQGDAASPEFAGANTMVLTRSPRPSEQQGQADALDASQQSQETSSSDASQQAQTDAPDASQQATQSQQPQSQAAQTSQDSQVAKTE